MTKILATVTLALCLLGVDSRAVHAKDPWKDYYKAQEKQEKAYLKYRRKQAHEWEKYQRKQAKNWRHDQRKYYRYGW